MFYSFNINGKYKFLLHNLFPRGFDAPVLPKTWISIVFKSLIFFFPFFFLKSKCTEHASLSYCFWKQTLGLSEEKGSGWRRRRRSQSYDARVCDESTEQESARRGGMDGSDGRIHTLLIGARLCFGATLRAGRDWNVHVSGPFAEGL